MVARTHGFIVLDGRTFLGARVLQPSKGMVTTLSRVRRQPVYPTLAIKKITRVVKGIDYGFYFSSHLCSM